MHAADADEDGSAFGNFDAGCQLALGERNRELIADTHDFAGGSHFRAQHNIHASELAKWKHAFFDAEVVRLQVFGDAERFQFLAGHDFRCDVGDRDTGGFGNERNGSTSARIHFEDVDHMLAGLFIFLDRELNVHQPDDIQAFGHRDGGLANFGDGFSRKRVRRDRAC